MQRYAVFFLDFICDVRPVEDSDTETSIIIPMDTRFFCFVRTACKYSAVKNGFYTNKASNGKHIYTFGLPVENNTLFFLGKGPKNRVYNEWTGECYDLTPYLKWKMKIILIDPMNLNLQEFSNIKKEAKSFTFVRDSNSSKAHYKIVLETTGNVRGTYYDVGNGMTCDVFHNYDSLISIIEVIAMDHPEIYREIIAHIDSDEHIYYACLAKFCKEHKKP